MLSLVDSKRLYYRTALGLTEAQGVAQSLSDLELAYWQDPTVSDPGVELASAESRVVWNTTVVGSYVEVLPLTMSYATVSRPAWDQISSITWYATATGRCYVEIIDGLTGLQISNNSSDLTANVRQQMPSVAGRIPARTSLRFYKVLVFQTVAGTLTLDISALQSIVHQAVLV